MGFSPREDPGCYMSPVQREVLARLFSLDFISEDFFLTRGTALAVFYLHHRVSEDLDLFTIAEKNLSDFVPLIRRILAPERVISERGPSYLSYIVEGVKVDLVVDTLSYKGDRPRVLLEPGVEISLDTVDNIRVNKACTLVSRGLAKDAVDFWLLCKDKGFESIMEILEEGARREVLLEDLGYVAEVFAQVGRRGKELIAGLQPYLKVELDPLELEGFFLGLSERLEKLLEEGA